MEYYEERDGVLGYRQMTIVLNREKQDEIVQKINQKRVRRLMQIHGLRSVIRRKPPEYVRSTPEVTAENVLNRDFKADKPFQKWGTDVNTLVFDTFNEAVRPYSDAKPIFHSDRGYQYTNKKFHQKLMDAGMTQSMSRVGRFLDNALMKGWLGIIKSEMYYLRKFTGKDALVATIEKYINYYNTHRYQKRLMCMTPCEYYAAVVA